MTNTVKLMDKATKRNVEVSIHEHDSKLNKYPHYVVSVVIDGKVQSNSFGCWSLTQAREHMYSVLPK